MVTHLWENAIFMHVHTSTCRNRILLLMAFLSLYSDYMRMLSSAAHAKEVCIRHVWKLVSETGETN